jgi:hypothetical protein
VRPQPGRLGVDVFGQPPEPPADTPQRTVIVAHRLGLLPMERPPVCHGYSNCCACHDCTERRDRPVDLKPKRIRQPWEPLPLDDAA